MITGAGGTIMNTAAASATGDSYWASRETSSGTSAFYVRFGKPLAWDKSNAKKTVKICSCSPFNLEIMVLSMYKVYPK